MSDVIVLYEELLIPEREPDIRKQNLSLGKRKTNFDPKLKYAIQKEALKAIKELGLTTQGSMFADAYPDTRLGRTKVILVEKVTDVAAATRIVQVFKAHITAFFAVAKISVMINKNGDTMIITWI